MRPIYPDFTSRFRGILSLFWGTSTSTMITCQTSSHSIKKSPLRAPHRGPSRKALETGGIQKCLEKYTENPNSDKSSTTQSRALDGKQEYSAAREKQDITKKKKEKKKVWLAIVSSAGFGLEMQAMHIAAHSPGGRVASHN